MEFVAPKRVPVSPKLVPLAMLVLVISGQVFGFYQFTLPDYMMVGQVMKTFFRVDRMSCLRECHVNEQCMSYNFEPSTEGKGLCELNKCGVEDDHEREKSLIYTRGVLFHQIRRSKAVAKDGSICWAKPACSNAPSLGASYGGRIPDSSFSASSHVNKNSLPKYGRLNSPKRGWCQNTINISPSQYLQIDLGALYWICAVATQGANGLKNWTTKYKLSVSLNSSSWVIYNEKGSDKEFEANSDGSRVVRNALSTATKARYIRFIPTAAGGKQWPVLRVDVFGWKA